MKIPPIGRAPGPYLQELTEFNRLALPYYKEACRIMALPFDQRRTAIGDDDRLAAEVRRVHELRINRDQ
ncbi:MAG TPA: hypothetical protein DCZ12_07270 [Gammaproteobacteria bacterium]|jgi:hypothetical protein|nr:hypothetical protein [Gammaproteobacteria bacterium]